LRGRKYETCGYIVIDKYRNIAKICIIKGGIREYYTASLEDLFEKGRAGLKRRVS